ncbi:hypothetical protein D9756_010387 [Leucocoprinus leucothites]|uniref:Uncharacterized protein n=1 Tax=Leucocoprinus leucothites TaxID=201217 RepID=A0A8H5FRR3_9AGAR|nr:hypothetical protein D9756_010387 [Leucoagaricus leucothites]
MIRCRDAGVQAGSDLRRFIIARWLSSTAGVWSGGSEPNPNHDILIPVRLLHFKCLGAVKGNSGLIAPIDLFFRGIEEPATNHTNQPGHKLSKGSLTQSWNARWVQWH